MESGKQATVRDVLLTRRGLVFVSSTGAPLSENHVRAIELELADVGYVLSSRLRAHLMRCSWDELLNEVLHPKRSFSSYWTSVRT
jgi:hypothetical protein